MTAILAHNIYAVTHRYINKQLLSKLIFIFLSLTSSYAYALPDLSLGLFGPGIQDGTEPFNEDGNCSSVTAKAAAGDDCGEANNQVRTQDSVIFNWSITASNYTPGQTNPKNVVLEQILHPGLNAKLAFARIPARCLPAGGGGTNPASAITTETNGDIKLTCNLGELTDGGQISFSTLAKVSGLSWNGSSFTSSQRLYSNDDAGSPNANSDVLPTVGPFEISARPMADLSSSSFRGYYLYGDRDVGQGPEPGYYTWVNMRLASPHKSGTEAIKQPFTYTFDLSATKAAVNGVDYTNAGFEYHMVDCFYNTIGWGDNLWGREAHGASDLTTYPLEKKVIESGTCNFNRTNTSNPASPYTMSISGTDLSGNRYPTRTIGGTDLSAGPYYYMDMLARFFIPMRVIDNADGVMDGNGSIYIKNILGNFSPEGVSGVQNFNGVEEPGFNGNPMPDGTISNNIAQPYNYYLTTQGSWAHYAFPQDNDGGTGYTYFAPNDSHSGQGLLPPGKAFASVLHFGNNGSNNLSHPQACNVFDNSTLKLVDRSSFGATAGTYAYVGTYNASGFDANNYLVEYGHIDLTGDDPIDKNGDGAADYNNQTGRYEGKWDVQGLARCNDSTTTWKTDPTQVGSGIDDVNIIRVRLKDSVQDTVKLSSAQYIRFVTPLAARNNFYQGPHNGELIPMGTVMATFGSVRTDEYWGGVWTPDNSRPYQPSPETGVYDGDRVTLARTTTRLDSETLIPLATPGNTNSTIAGNQVVWKVNTAIQSLLSTPPQETGVKIIAELPPEVSYNQTCTAGYTDANGVVIGTTADLVEFNTDRNGLTKTGYTRLTWNLGTVTADVAMAPRVICTDSAPLAKNNTSVVGYFEIKGDTLISALAQHSDTHTITLEQIGSIQVSKKVDTTLDNQNDSQIHTISWANFAESFSIAAPTVIDVLPYNGDATATNTERSPASNFVGTLTLQQAPTITWMDGSVPGGAEASMGTWYYSSDTPSSINSNPDQNTSNWCLESSFGSGAAGCPNSFANVTAIKFVSNYALEKDGLPRQGMKATLTLQASNNNPGNRYTNRFAFDTPSLPAAQFLRSNNETVYIASYSLGDYLFSDNNHNQKFDAGLDKPAPEGVTVNLHKADGSLVKTTTTGLQKPGRYLFNLLGAGDYYIEIPASEFQTGGKLEGWDIDLNSAPASNDSNELNNQDGYKTNTPASVGIRSNLITLSATPPLPGQVPKGDEPIGDNTASLTDSTGDDFSNYTLDLGLTPIYDYGDAPATYGVAAHIQQAALAPKLGVVAPDAEPSSAHSPDAKGDGNDETSLSQFPAWEVGRKCSGLLANGQQGTVQMTATSYCLTVKASNPSNKAAQLIAWIDFNNNQAFDESSERSVAVFNNNLADDTTQGNLPANSSNQTIVLQWTGVTPPTSPSVFVRLRVTTDPDFKTSSLATSTAFAADGEVEDYQFDLSLGYPVSGRVYQDQNVNGVSDANEPGLADVPVVLLNTTSNTCVSVQTDAQGYYQFNNVPTGTYRLYEAANAATPPVCDLTTARDPSDYLSSTANALPSFTVNAIVTDKNFGDVKLPSFTLDNHQTINPGASVVHQHIFQAQTTGSVSFSVKQETATPTNLAWGITLHQDMNCDGQLDGGDQTLNTSLNVSAGQKICILTKVLAPTNVSGEANHSVEIQSSFIFGNGSLIAAPYLQVHTDLTDTLDDTSSEPIDGKGKLALVKSVWNVTRNIKGEVALPGEKLRYSIRYENTGNGLLNELIVHDAIPEFTQMVTGSQQCVSTPSELSACTPTLTNKSLKWAFTGKLKAGSSGEVSYEVIVD
ncbi:MAG: SdrD B-like domain-containing protein [Thiolinea sp.]